VLQMTLSSASAKTKQPHLAGVGKEVVQGLTEFEAEVLVAQQLSCGGQEATLNGRAA